MLLPTLNQAREKARRISCANNLKQMGLALKQYAMDFNSYFPLNAASSSADGAESLTLLITEEYMTDYKMFTCPSTTTTPGDSDDELLYSGTGANLDYAYTIGLMEGDSDAYGRSDSALAADIDNTSGASGVPNHSDYGNILYHDGHVSGFTGSSWFSDENSGSTNVNPNTGE